MSKRESSVAVWLIQRAPRLPLTVQHQNHGHQNNDEDQKLSPKEILNLTNVLVGLPDEIILSIADFLSPPSRVLLSLCSKRLRSVVITPTRVSLKQRVEFLKLLEKDLPDYLTCSSCGFMFNWRCHALPTYRCPRALTNFNSHSIVSSWCHTHGISIGREMMALIVRAHQYGPSYGIPASCADHECDSDGMYRRIEGRIVDGHFMMARSCILPLDYIKARLNRDMEFSACFHITYLIRRKFKTYVQEIGDDWACDLDMKCDRCTTDAKVRFVRQANEPAQVEANVWQKFEITGSHVRDGYPKFPVDYARVEDGDAKKRDLESDFVKSKESSSESDPGEPTDFKVQGAST